MQAPLSDSYFKCVDQSFIQNSILGFITRKTTVTLWQTVQGERRKFQVQFVDYNELNSECVVSIGQQVLDLAPSAFYIWEPAKDVVCKVTDYRISGETLIFKLPRGWMAKEMRSAQRIKLDTVKNDIVTFQLTNYDVENPKEFSLKMRDISATGCGVVLSKTIIEHFKVGHSVYIRQLGSDRMPALLEAKIMYCHLVTTNGRHYSAPFRMGLRFVRNLNLRQMNTTKVLVRH